MRNSFNELSFHPTESVEILPLIPTRQNSLLLFTCTPRPDHFNSSLRLPFLLTLFSLLFSVEVFGQSASVDPLTGRAQVSIPLGVVSEGDLSVPIAVAYDGGGVRVEQGEGSAGMSWNLIAGGGVYRELRALPDDYLGASGDSRVGWLYNGTAASINNFVPSADDSFVTCSDETADYNFLISLTFNIDTEPDIFHFSAPGLSGQFVFDASGVPRVIPYRDLKLDIIRQGGTGPIDEIKITNNVGVVYRFAQKETAKRKTYQTGTPGQVYHFLATYAQYLTELEYTTSWKLASITSPTGAQLLFGYSSDEHASSETKIRLVDDGGAIDEQYRIKDEGDYFRLSSIGSTQLGVDFTWDENRISTVTFNDNYHDNSIQYDFIYGEARDHREGPVSQVRNFLKELRLGEACATFPSYVFSYVGVNLESHSTGIPFNEKNRQDFWGFYNENSLTKVPDIYFYSGQQGAERFRLSELSSQSADQILTGASRNASSIYAATGSLSTIEYPTGSIETINYELNSFYDDTLGDSVQGSGVRVRMIGVHGGEKGSEKLVTRYSYRLANGMTSGKQLYRPVYAFGTANSTIYRSLDNLAPDGGVMYSRITVSQSGKGKTVYEFLNPALYPSESSGGSWVATKTKIARNGCNATGYLQIGAYTYPFAPNPDFDFERGLLDKISDFDEGGTLVRERSFTYQQLHSPILIKGLRYEPMASGTFLYAHYNITANTDKVIITETERLADEITPANLSETVTTYAYNSTHKMLESVAAINSDATTYRTKYRYAKDFAALTNPDPTKPEAVALKSLNDTNRHGQVVETISYRQESGGPEVAVGASLTLFKDFGDGKVLPHKTLAFPPTISFAETSITGSPQQLSVDSDYITVATVQSVNSLGMPMSITDNKKNKTGLLYGMGESAVIATVGNALAEETVYDGFESGSPYGLVVGGGAATTVAGWTGINAMQVLSSTTMTREIVQKGYPRYRFSCWVKSSSSPSITARAKDGSTTQSSVAVNYSGGGQWQYLEGIMDMTSVSSTFSLEIVASATADLDDIRFLPEKASMSVTTMLPLAGPTSASDDRGVTGFKEYDELGRLRYTLDRNKNIVQVDDYRYKKEVIVPLQSNFTDDTPDDVHTGTSYHFAAPVNCGNPSYSWQVDDVEESTGANLTYEFDELGYHIVKLIVTSSTGSVATTKSFCVVPGLGTGTVKLNTSDQDLYECEPSTMRTIVANNIGGCPNPANLNYDWYYKPNSSNDWYPISDHDNSVDFDIATAYGLESFNIKCIVTGDCGIDDATSDDCNGIYGFSAEKIMAFTYVDDRPCQ